MASCQIRKGIQTDQEDRSNFVCMYDDETKLFADVWGQKETRSKVKLSEKTMLILFAVVEMSNWKENKK